MATLSHFPHFLGIKSWLRQQMTQMWDREIEMKNAMAREADNHLLLFNWTQRYLVLLTNDAKSETESKEQDEMNVQLTAEDME